MSDREINWLHERLGGIETPELNGDNLAILLCTFFDDPDEEQDDNGWSLSAVKGCDSILDAIRKHYAPAFERLIRERDEARAHLEALSVAATCACSYDYPDDVCMTHQKMRAEAEAAGYRRGKEEAEIAGREILLPLKREQAQRLMKHAEAVGYRRGVEDAARIVSKYEEWDTIVENEILALAEKAEIGATK